MTYRLAFSLPGLLALAALLTACGGDGGVGGGTPIDTDRGFNLAPIDSRPEQGSPSPGICSPVDPNAPGCATCAEGAAEACAGSFDEARLQAACGESGAAACGACYEGGGCGCAGQGGCSSSCAALFEELLSCVVSACPACAPSPGDVRFPRPPGGGGEIDPPPPPPPSDGGTGGFDAGGGGVDGGTGIRACTDADFEFCEFGTACEDFGTVCVCDNTDGFLNCSGDGV